MKEKLLEYIGKVAEKYGIDNKTVVLEYPEDPKYGDFSTNIALVNAKRMKMNPRDLATRIVADLKDEIPEYVNSLDIAGSGFINFYIKDGYFAREALAITRRSARDYFSDTSSHSQNTKSILIEHTDPNTFKPFHIGHLMANAIGESLSRLISYSGDRVTKLCYPSDIGLHIAKSIWAIMKTKEKIPNDTDPVIERTAFLGKMYALGTSEYESNEGVKKEIDRLNKVIYDKSDAKVNEWYEKGKRWSMEHFELLFGRLDTKFDEYLFESEMAPLGQKIVRENLGKVFEESEGAVVFHGENHGLHTRVFINSQGLPTYEAKELGLNTRKFDKYPDTDTSIVVTANEQNDYFKVLLKALSLIRKEVGENTIHIGHGMLRLSSGKMSSRTGNVITAEALLDDIKKMVLDKIEKTQDESEDNDHRRGSTFSEQEKSEVADMVAIAAVKYTILRQAIGGDIIFDSTKSISFEGDSGPYLQYSAVRAASILEKAKAVGAGLTTDDHADLKIPDKVGSLERLLVRFPDIVSRARDEYAPQHVANYLIALAGEFNSFYGRQVIVDLKDPLSSYYVRLTEAFRQVMIDGLWILGIKVPKKM